MTDRDRPATKRSLRARAAVNYDENSFNWDSIAFESSDEDERQAPKRGRLAARPEVVQVLPSAACRLQGLLLWKRRTAESASRLAAGPAGGRQLQPASGGGDSVGGRFQCPVSHRRGGGPAPARSKRNCLCAGKGWHAAFLII